jgi:type III pantothenate kinase
MLLTVDVGNTNVTLGLYDGERLTHHFRLQSDRERTADEYGLMMKALMAHAGVGDMRLSAAAMCSVVPPLTHVLEEALKRYFEVDPLTVGPGIKTSMPILYENPREVGADRIVNAVAGWERHHCAMVIVDFGTATTFDAVSGKGEYLGGAISPGVGISMDALFRAAAKLPRVDFQQPSKVVGRNTVHSIQSGLFWGYVGLVDGVVERMVKEMDAGKVRVIATGGLAPLLSGQSRTIETEDEFLKLDGLRILYERNRRVV